MTVTLATAVRAAPGQDLSTLVMVSDHAPVPLRRSVRAQLWLLDQQFAARPQGTGGPVRLVGDREADDATSSSRRPTCPWRTTTSSDAYLNGTQLCTINSRPSVGPMTPASLM